jgi:ferredoxin
MKNVIYYFSGRGNSLSMARGLAERMGEACYRPMARESGEVMVSGGMLGFVLPVIEFGLPILVRNFIGRLRPGAEKPYVFAIITCGGMPAASLQALARLLKKRGLELSAGEYMVFGLERMTEDEWRGRLDGIAAAVMDKKTSPLPEAALLHRMMTDLVNPIARMTIPAEDKKFRVDDACAGCGDCVRICPVNNIELKEGKPVWLHHCEQCAACFSWCPRQAISGACLAARTHYTNPRVQSGEMLMD